MPTLGLNAAITVGAGLVGVRNDPYAAFGFFVEIEGLIVGNFSEVSGLQVEVEVQDYREGGRNDYIHKLPGPTRYPSNLVLKRGLTDIETLWRWHQDVAQGTIERRNGTIYLLDRSRLPAVPGRLPIPAMWWDFKGAYPVRWVGPELRADTNAIAVETVELVHQGISKPQASGAVSALRGAIGAAAQLL